ncbi:MAG: DUF815 domain-containing protein [Deltaproteobacteria bacterium]|jgi:uncharacterized protein|nr:DUF815 domain-containing protein [Deltaproteobacteria bacterium]MBT4641839.1 DUF815 domain-containing protein [Deltaproteobacteria bacterium]MBT6504580.1 DUF815 domain-containing protein [Deltaproteobacteria bacterium]MBT6612194.1 DUF815 domain-containing protein [Deltaproteobacteria bacterium]MBT7151197.1 DUF815 domain-containing protein [Deltaproteobacteria bacterium]
MKIQKKKTAYIESGKWDESAINQVYENLLDGFGGILDRIQFSGCRSLFESNDLLKVVWRLFELMENELLVQWKIKQEEGLERLFDRQKRWLSLELRSADGLLTTWNQYCTLAWKRLDSPVILLDRNPWRSAVLETLTDRQSYADMLGIFKSDQHEQILGSVCLLFEKLYRICPYHQILSFLSLIEMGAGNRPEISNPGDACQTQGSDSLPSSIDTFFLDIIEAGQWTGMPERLNRFWDHNSGGNFSLYPAFLAKKATDGTCRFQGVQPERWMQLDDLIGIETNKQRLIENTENLLAGKPAHHVLLWGGRGTGKSSSVQALLTRFVDSGLRLIEIQQGDLGLIPDLSNLLKEKKEKFILFCDDLSFEKDDVHYKNLKTVMEGSVLSPAGNLVVIATANRKDLVFRGEVDERYPEQKQLIDEKRAIDDRFGIKLFYEVPVYKQLEEILFHYADSSGCSYDREDLFMEFRRFAQRNNHDKPAGRTVQQFMQIWIREQKGAGNTSLTGSDSAQAML